VDTTIAAWRQSIAAGMNLDDLNTWANEFAAVPRTAHKKESGLLIVKYVELLTFNRIIDKSNS
jgi:hypothetical protein